MVLLSEILVCQNVPKGVFSAARMRQEVVFVVPDCARKKFLGYKQIW